MFKVFLPVCISLVCLRGADAPSFDVASIRPHAPDDTRFYVKLPAHGRFTAAGSVAKLVVMLARRSRGADRRRSRHVLTVAKDGPKFKPAEHDGSTNVRVGGNSISLERGDLVRMTQLLSSALGRPVVDRTGLTGLYDLSLKWDDAPVLEGGVTGSNVPATPGNDHGSIFTATQDQLGLRLDSQRAPVEVIVVDRMERPSPN